VLRLAGSDALTPKALPAISEIGASLPPYLPPSRIAYSAASRVPPLAAGRIPRRPSNAAPSGNMVLPLALRARGSQPVLEPVDLFATPEEPLVAREVGSGGRVVDPVLTIRREKTEGLVLRQVEDPPLPALALGDVRLRLAEPLRNLGLRESRCPARSPQALEELVVTRGEYRGHVGQGSPDDAARGPTSGARTLDSS
jgi:hypothetical protein